jgi:hypothetical protein
LLFEFYEVYLSVTEKSSQQSWIVCQLGKTLLQDFNEIDRYLLDFLMFCLTKRHWRHKKWGLKKIKHNSENYIDFWKLTIITTVVY